MPEHFRALIVILFLASVVFLMARRPATDLIPLSDYKRRRNLWFLLTLLAFFSHSFWLYLGVGAVVLLLAGRREHNPMALFYMLLFLIPPASVQVPGFGVVNYLVDLNHIRLLSLCVLLPAALHLRRLPRKEFDTTVDVWLAPSQGHLPVRIRITQANGDVADQRLIAP